MSRPSQPTATLVVSCPDRMGIVAAISNFLFEHRGNILHSDQHSDREQGLFTLRTEWALEGFGLEPAEFADAFRPLAERFSMQWRISRSDAPRRVAILVSKQLHCLSDLLYRHGAGELNCVPALVLSNHGDGEALARFHGVPFARVEVTPADKTQAEARQRDLLAKHGIELVVLARYMQVLSPAFVAEWPNRIINIHHSFLPAFTGAKPYHQAYERGVKLIGATSHYVTDTLDEGPIIDQDVIRISHRDPVDGLVEKGRDLERVVLSRAVRRHLEDRIVVHGNKTIVFE
jgi:formyltetrahydrofolate deformylase